MINIARPQRWRLANQKNEISRLRKEYNRRAARLSGKDIYAYTNPTHLFAMQQRERQLFRLLFNNHLHTLRETQILEIGCGSGGALLDFLQYDVAPQHLFGIDLLHNRLQVAHKQLPTSNFINADGQSLPFPCYHFDLLLQFTAFSSILDKDVKHNMAAEMLRVLKPDGAILWYDFWWNPTNPQTAGIKPKEIKILFSNCVFRFQKITLAPPIARLIVPISWPFALILESLQIFNSHYIAIIKKDQS